MKKLLPVALLAIAACTQEPVQVVLKGNQFFGRDGQQMAQNSYTSSVAFNSQSTESRIVMREEPPAEPQQIGSVGVSELPPLVPPSVENDLSEIKLIPAGAAVQSQPEGLRMATAVTQDKTWYNGEIELKNDRGLDSPAFIWPVRGKIISHFGKKANGSHNDGINISAHLGDPIYASSNGTVVYAGSDLKDYGNMVILRHENGWMSAYAHADRLLVKENERVSQGQRIATVGTSGSVDTAQLHFGLRNGKSPVDPAKFLGSDFASAR